MFPMGVGNYQIFFLMVMIHQFNLMDYAIAISTDPPMMAVDDVQPHQ